MFMLLITNSSLFNRLINSTLLLIILIPLNVLAQWMQSNGPEGGDVRVIVSDSTMIYVGLYSGGVHSSTDNGISWTRKNSGLPVTLQVQAMLVKDQYVFVGLLNWRVYVSSNQGQTWDEANNGLPNSTVQMLAKADSFIFAGFTNGLYRSSNYGANWNHIGTGLTNIHIKALALKDSIIFLGTEDGVFISTNYGNNWIERSNGLVNRWINDFTITGNIIFVATEGGVFKSSDNGNNWFAANSGLPVSSVGSIETIDSVVFAGTHWYGTYISTDFGISWNVFNDAYPPNVYTYTLLSRDNTIFVGNKLGIYGANLPDPTWNEMNNELYGSNIHCFAVKDSVLVAGTEAGGVFISSDLGETWTSRRIINGYNGPIALEFKGDSLYALCFSGGLFVSTDFGLNWNFLNIPTQYYTSLAVRDINIFVGTDQAGIWRSTNSGSSWAQINSGLTNLFIKAIAVDDSNVYCGTNEGLFISSDNGENWAIAGPGISQTIGIETIKIINNYIYVGAIYGIYLSTNRGANWSYKGFGNDIVECIEGYGDVVFAGTPDPWDGGIFVSTNKGGTWQEFNSGLPYLGTFALAIVDTTIFAGIWGHSAWKTSNIVTDVPDPGNIIPTDYVLSQNFPNPFNPTTKIEYKIPELSFVILKIYDVLGKEVGTLVNEEKSIGKYNVEFNATNLPSGIYFYRLQAGSFVETKKMVLLR